MSPSWTEQKNFIAMLEFTYDKACVLLTALSLDKGETEDFAGMESQAHLVKHRHPAHRLCLICGKDSHTSDLCPTGLPLKDKHGRNIIWCWNCQQQGHTHRHCTYGMSGPPAKNH